MASISPYIIVPIVTVLVSQIIKFAMHAFSNEIDFKQLVKVGGPPSSFVAAAVALVVTSLAVDGIDTSITGAVVVSVAFIIKLFVENSKVVGRLNSSIDEKSELTKLPEHSNKDMLIGGVIGLVSALILSVSYYKDDVDWLFSVPPDSQINIGFAFFGLTLVVSEFLSFLTRRKNMRKLPTSRKLSRAFRLSLTLPAVLGLFFTFAQKETLGMFDTRIWSVLIVLWILIASAWFYRSVYKHAGSHLAEEREHFKKTQAKSKKSKTGKGKKKTAKKRK